MTLASVARRWLIAAAVGIAFAAAIVVVLQPGQHDLFSAKWTGMQAVDDGYWTSPLRRVAGAGRQDEYDERLATSLALPENAIGGVAYAVGVPFQDARFTATLLAAAVLATLAVGTRRWLLFAAILCPPVLGHLTSDLGEGPACAIVAAWAIAISSGRLGLAAVLAGVGLSQKACGLFLGVGSLVAALEARPRGPALLRTGLCALLGASACATVASLVFGDSSLDFVLRPFVATRETEAGIAWKGVPAQMLFAAYHGPSRFAVGVFVAALALLAARPVRPAIVVAAAASLLWVGVFPQPWRIVPVLPLFVLMAKPRRDSTDGALAAVKGARRVEPTSARWWHLDAMVLVGCQVVASWFGLLLLWDREPANFIQLGATAVVLVALFAWLRSFALRDGARRAPLIVAVACIVGIAASLGLSIGMLSQGRERRRLDFAETVATGVPAGSSVIGHTFLASRFHGTLYYPPFASLWQPELDAEHPSQLYRLRSWHSESPPPPAGYRVTASERVGNLPSPDGSAREMVLETLTR